MNPLFATLASLAAAVGFYGCDGAHLDALKPGVSTVQEVRERFGPPAAEWRDADGGLTLEYPRGPEGEVCWMLSVDHRGILKAIEQVLTEDNFARIERGWTPEQVRRLLGRPASVAEFPLKPEIVWDWRIAPSHSGNRAWFQVHFSRGDGGPGVVTGTSRREETPG